MAAVTEMSEADRLLHGRDPDKQRYGEATRWIRDLEVQRAYLLRAKLQSTHNREERDAVLLDWAEDSGRSVGTLKAELKWTNAIAEEDLRGAFRKAKIPEYEWEKRLGTSHLGVIARAFNQETGEVLTSPERAELAVDCYEGNLSVEELGNHLRNRGLLPPKKGMSTAPSKAPDTLCRVLRRIADVMEQSGQDIDMHQMLAGKEQEQIRVAGALRKLGNLVEQLYPNAKFTLVEEGKPGGQVQQ